MINKQFWVWTALVICYFQNFVKNSCCVLTFWNFACHIKSAFGCILRFCNSVITTLFLRQCSQLMLIWMLANCSKCLSWGYNLIDGYYSAFASIIPTNMLSCYVVKHWLCNVNLSIPRSMSLYYEEIAKHILPFSVKNPSDPDTIKLFLPSQVGKVVFGYSKENGISLNIFSRMFTRRHSHKVKFWSSNRLILLVVRYLYQIRFYIFTSTVAVTLLF